MVGGHLLGDPSIPSFSKNPLRVRMVKEVVAVAVAWAVARAAHHIRCHLVRTRAAHVS